MVENIGEFSCLDYLEEKTLVNGHQFAKFTNVFSCQHFLLYGRREYLTAIYRYQYEPVKPYGFAQRTPKGVNEMTLVLLNDVDDSCMPHLFFMHVCAILKYLEL